MPLKLPGNRLFLLSVISRTDEAPETDKALMTGSMNRRIQPEMANPCVRIRLTETTLPRGQFISRSYSNFREC